MERPYCIEFEQMGSPELGYLSVAQAGELLPFEIKRVFWNYQVPEGTERGNHAYRLTAQVLVALQGRVRITLESTRGESTEYVLNHPRQGLLVPPRFWRKVQFFDHAVMIVFSSREFDPADSIRNYVAFRALEN